MDSLKLFWHSLWLVCELVSSLSVEWQLRMITHEGFKVHGLHKRAYLGFEFQVAYIQKKDWVILYFIMNSKTLSVDRLLFLIGSYVFYINLIWISKFG